MKSNTIEFLKDTFHLITYSQAYDLLAVIRRNMEIDNGRAIVQNHKEDFIAKKDYKKAFNNEEYLISVAQTYDERITTDTGEVEINVLNDIANDLWHKNIMW